MWRVGGVWVGVWGVGVRDIPQGCPVDAPQHWPESASDSVEESLSHIQYI